VVFLSNFLHEYGKTKAGVIKIGIKFHQMHECFFNNISANDGRHGEATSTSEEMLHTYYVHVLFCKG
jgi:hypothetical protein